MAGVRMATVPRTDLVQHFITALVDTRVGIVEGGPGFGRTTLLGELARAWPHDTFGSWGGLSAARASLAARTRPCLILVDDADDLPWAQRTALAEFATELPAPHRLVLVTRGHCPVLRHVDGTVGGPRVRAAQLLLSAAELERVLWGSMDSPTRTATHLFAATGGWAEGVRTVLTRGLKPVDGLPNAAAAVVSERVETLQAAHRLAFSRALTMPLLRAPLLRLLAEGDDLIRLLLAARVPLARLGGDVWSLPGRLDVLLPRAPLRREQGARALRWCDHSGHAGEAFALLWRAGQTAAALDRLEGATGPEAEALLEHWRDPIDVTAHDLLRVPVASERALRAADRAGHPDPRPFVRQVEARRRADPVLHERLRAQAARDLLQRGRSRAAERAAAELLRDGVGPAARAMALEVLGRAARRRGGLAHLARAERLLKQSLALWRRAEEPGRVAELRLALAWVDRDLAASPRALERAAAVRASVTPGEALWIQAAMVEADVLCDVGRCREADALLLAVETAGGDWLGPRLFVRIAVLRARAAVHLEEPDLAAHRLREAGEPLGLIDGVCGVRTVAAVAELWSRLPTGDAGVWAGLLRTLQVEPDLEATIARASVACREGDPVSALRRLRALLASDALPPRERWRVALLAGQAAARAGAPDVADLVGTAFREAAVAGQPRAPFVRERELARDLLRVAGPFAGDVA